MNLVCMEIDYLDKDGNTKVIYARAHTPAIDQVKFQRILDNMISHGKRPLSIQHLFGDDMVIYWQVGEGFSTLEEIKRQQNRILESHYG